MKAFLLIEMTSHYSSFPSFSYLYQKLIFNIQFMGVGALVIGTFLVCLVFGLIAMIDERF